MTIQEICIVCKNQLKPFFEKDFDGQWSLNKVEYWKCSCCGLTIAKTLCELSQREWEELNNSYHMSLFDLTSNSLDPRWSWHSRGIQRLYTQAQIIDLLFQQGLLPKRLFWIDYGCGDGLLADDLAQRKLPIYKFDPYIQGDGFLTKIELEQLYSVVITTGVFEHVRTRDGLDKIVHLVAEDGVLAFHTLVCEVIPKDPNWFYLLPGHCILFTNASMQKLFEQWGFVASLYHVPSRMWFWFRENIDAVERFMENCPKDFCMRNAFVDYWK